MLLLKSIATLLHQDTTDPLVVGVHGEKNRKVRVPISWNPSNCVQPGVIQIHTAPSNTALIYVLCFNYAYFGRCLDRVQALSTNL